MAEETISESTSLPEASTPSPVSEDQPLVREFDINQRPKLKEVLVPAGIILAIISAGGATGYFLANKGGALISPLSTSRELVGGAELVQGPKEVGIKDVETFRDTAEGRVEANDDPEISEGSHKLIRPGGPSQTAYVTSSVIDLNEFLGKCVQVWGETFAAQKAGWLMDIGRVKILDSCPKGI